MGLKGEQLELPVVEPAPQGAALAPLIVRAIISEYRCGDSPVRLAARYGVTLECVHSLIARDDERRVRVRGFPYV